MKKIAAIILMSFILSGCSTERQRDLAEEIIAIMISVPLESAREYNEDHLPVVLETYFSKDGYTQLVSDKTGYIYSEYLRLTGARDTEGIKIKKVKKNKVGPMTQLTCFVEYRVIYDEKKVKMEDTIVLSFNKENEVTRFLILNSSDIIGKMFLNLRVM